MKLSVSWIFDHINADWRKQDIDFLVSQFNKISAEIENYYKVKFNLDKFAAAKVESKNEDKFKVSIPEWKKNIELPKREEGTFFIVTNKDGRIRWADLNDFNLLKDGLIPEIDIQEKDLNGNWKKNFETEDVILEVDNKSITHRPDMWGHRGFAREIAAFMDLEFLPSNKFLVDKEIFNYDKKAPSTQSNPISIKIDASQACHRFAGIYFDNIKNKPCNPFVLNRLLKVDARPINLLVDITNYLTLDWSQPVHAYDAAKIEGQEIIARMAKKDEKLKLLDEAELILTDQDLVITDEKKPLCLGGVMGGFYSGINKDTKSIFFESANFDATYVRRTALRHKIRTESSMRFEKTLDKNQNVQGILRFLYLLNQFNVDFKVADEILSVGAPAKEVTLQVSHDFLERRAGVSFHDYDITVPLTKLGFEVQQEDVEQAGKKDFKTMYSITVPTYRSSKDVETKEDILEEVIRFYGFDRIELELPALKKRPENLDSLFRKRKIKNFLVNAANMTEQQNYIFFDEKFIKSINLKPKHVAAYVINPVSIDQTRLITSLLPGLFKNVKDNFMEQDCLRFFELGRIWLSGKEDNIIENKSLAGIFFEKRKQVDFYNCKNYITDLLKLVGIDFKKSEWKKVENPENIWEMPYQTAEIYWKDKKIGTMGKVNPVFLSQLEVLPESDACFFELDGDFLLKYKTDVKKFTPLAKYQENSFDLSLFVPLNIKTMDLEKGFKKVDKLIKNVELIDFFEKEDWLDKRSLTFRLTISSPEKTLEKSEIDKVWQSAIKFAQKSGATLRE
ncbi:phenylalanine--tRNA ligase subunit beta [Candidatus Dependentiae bacterium]|nr:phenylalanine--tRNA ligase subunit beta [Candidatus Dependentiae bacterium]